MGTEGGRQPQGQPQGQPRGQQTDDGGGLFIAVAIAMAVFGIFSLGYAILGLLLGGLVSGAGSAGAQAAADVGSQEAQQAAQQVQQAGMIIMVTGIVKLILGITEFASIYGVVKRKSWGFYTVVGTMGVELLIVVLGIAGIAGSGFSPLGAVFGVAFAGILAYTFMNQDYFGMGSGGSPARV